MLKHFYRFFTLTIAVLPCFKQKKPNFKGFALWPPLGGLQRSPDLQLPYYVPLTRLFLFCKKPMRPYFFPYYPLRPANIYFFKVSNRSTRKKNCEICSKLTIQTQERRQWRRSNVFIINFEYISQLFLVFLLLNLKKRMLAGLCVTWTYLFLNHLIFLTLMDPLIFDMCYITFKAITQKSWKFW